MAIPWSTPPSLVPALLLLALCAGCAAPTPASSPEGSASSPPVAAAESASPVGPWPLGRWLRYDVTAASSLAGEVVAVFDGDRFAADRRPWALEEATRDVPILGRLDPSTLETTAFGQPWRPLDLPLEDGKAWAATVPIPDGFGQPVPQPVDFTARAATVFLPGRQEAGYQVVGMTGGNVSVEMAYSPSLHLPVSIRLWPPGADAPTWDALLREDGTGWTEPVWTAQARSLVAEHALVAPNEDDPASPHADPAFTAEFAGPPPEETVFGYLVAVAFAGGSRLELTDADGGRVAATAVGAPAQADVRLVDTPGKPGTWRVAAAGVGAVAFELAYLWAVDVREIAAVGPAGTGAETGGERRGS